MTPPTTPDATTLLTLEHQAWSALTHSGRALLPLLADDSVMVFPGGMKLSAESEPSLASILTDDSFTPWSTYVFSDESVVPLGAVGDSAVVVYRVDAERPDQRFQALCSSCWRRCSEGEWRMVVHQQTPV